MPRSPALPAEKKVVLVLAVLAGELTAAEAARSAGVSDQAVCNWKRRFLEAGRHGLEAMPDQQSRREQLLTAQVMHLKIALGDAYLQLRSARAAAPARGGSGAGAVRGRGMPRAA